MFAMSLEDWRWSSGDEAVQVVRGVPVSVTMTIYHSRGCRASFRSTPFIVWKLCVRGVEPWQSSGREVILRGRLGSYGGVSFVRFLSRAEMFLHTVLMLSPNPQIMGSILVARASHIRDLGHFVRANTGRYCDRTYSGRFAHRFPGGRKKFQQQLSTDKALYNEFMSERQALISSRGKGKKRCKAVVVKKSPGSKRGSHAC